MQIRIVSRRSEIPSLNPNERIIHLAFRPSNQDIFELVEACPKIEVIQIPESYKRTVSKAIEIFLRMQRITLIKGDVWGHRKDLDEYRSIPDGAIEEIKNYKVSGEPVEEIETRMTHKYRISKDLVKFIIDNSVTA